jgi:hypothetical protein
VARHHGAKFHAACASIGRFGRRDNAEVDLMIWSAKLPILSLLVAGALAAPAKAAGDYPPTALAD